MINIKRILILTTITLMNPIFTSLPEQEEPNRIPHATFSQPIGTDAACSMKINQYEIKTSLGLSASLFWSTAKIGSLTAINAADFFLAAGAITAISMAGVGLVRYYDKKNNSKVTN